MKHLKIKGVSWYILSVKQDYLWLLVSSSEGLFRDELHGELADFSATLSSSCCFKFKDDGTGMLQIHERMAIDNERR
jgi:hypothetical protein